MDLDPLGKPPDLHHHIIMDLDLFGMHMHKHTFPDRRLLSSACLFTNNFKCDLAPFGKTLFNLRVTNVIRIVTFYTLPPLESPTSSWMT